MEQTKFHKNFTLNTNSFTNIDELLAYANNLSEETQLFLEDWFSASTTISVLTSGSTGKPKLILLKKEFVINSALATGSFFNLKENTTALLCLPMAYIAGKMMLIRALTLGWNLDIIKSDSFPLKNCNKTYHFCAMVPLQLENSISKIHLINTLIVGGGVVTEQLKDKLQTVTTAIFATYGMTETITHVAVKKLNNFAELQGSIAKQNFYTTLPNVTIYKDIRNCLVIDAPKISEEIIFTNDVVNLISDTHFGWLGRFDNVINSGGIKLHPEKIEEKLSKIISNRFFVAGIIDEKLGEKLILIIELENLKSLNFKTLLVENLKNLETLSKFEKPKAIYFLDAFVETDSKKIQRIKTLQKIIY